MMSFRCGTKLLELAEKQREKEADVIESDWEKGKMAELPHFRLFLFI